MSLSLLVKEKALAAGFDLAGIAPLDVWKDLDFARRWVEQGYGGEMHYLQNPKRDDPRQVLPSAQSVVCVGLIYNAPLPYSTQVANHPGSPADQAAPSQLKQAGGEDSPRGWISRYAWGRDYHDILRGKLEELRASIENLAPGAETRVYVDTGPVVERAFARYSGIGWVGKNTCLINQAKGSWFFLGVVLTNLALEPDLPAADRCGSCTRCLDACPTGALVKPHVMDASRCIAYFTIELKGSIPEEHRPAIGANVFGCDICQDVCPWNRSPEGRKPKLAPGADRSDSKGLGRAGGAITHLPAFQPLEIKLGGSSAQHDGDSPERGERSFSLFNPSLETLAQLSEEDFRRELAGSPLQRPKYRGWLRNLAVTMGNSGDRRFAPKLEELSRHGDAVVREHAQWALERLAPRGKEAKRE